MYAVAVDPPDSLDAFRTAARRLLAAGIAPDDVVWSADTLFAVAPPSVETALAVPHRFVTLAEAVACHRDDARWPLLYRALWRIHHGERTLPDTPSDPLLHRLLGMEAAVRRDAHRMTAFVRFRSCPDGEADHFIAWYEPAHRVLRRCAGFFVDRFAAMRFSILTPDLSLHWDRHALAFAPGLRREDAASEDAVEAWWQRYYAATFNPARTNERLLTAHIPYRFRRNLPEARLITGLIAEAGPRTARMVHATVQGGPDSGPEAGPGTKPAAIRQRPRIR